MLRTMFLNSLLWTNPLIANKLMHLLELQPESVNVECVWLVSVSNSSAKVHETQPQMFEPLAL